MSRAGGEEAPDTEPEFAVIGRTGQRAQRRISWRRENLSNRLIDEERIELGGQVDELRQAGQVCVSSFV